MEVGRDERLSGLPADESWPQALAPRKRRGGWKSDRRSADKTTIVQSTLLSRLVVLLLGESVPEPESLVTCTGDDSLSLWTHRKIEYAVRVPRQ